MKYKQRLELDWIGKDEKLILEPRILVNEKEKSFGNTEEGNLLIFGDNLLSLKALESNYVNSIKCIYIDPPYNTGSAFEHYDDGLEHSQWLSLIKPRLEIMRNLLLEDGSIWISIDDDECHYLKVLCDEIFGRSNFVSNVIWEKKYTVANDAKYFSDNHDHILIYAKNKEVFRLNKLKRTDEMNKKYKNPDNHKKGVWKATPLHAKSGSNKDFTYVFKNGVSWSPPVGTFPRFSVETLKRMDDSDEIWFGKDGTAIPSRKTFLCDLKRKGIPPLTIWKCEDVGHNHEAKKEVKAFNSKNVFATPKPERLIKRILELATEEGDIVLDSFAGSGTTGAVAQKMKRKWIMVELGEHCHSHIIPRMQMVTTGDDQGGISRDLNWQGGSGFVYKRLASSLLQKDDRGNWIISKNYDSLQLAEAVCKIEKFKFSPDREIYWKQGYSSEKDFIFVTTQFLTSDYVDHIQEQLAKDETLLICAKAFRIRKNKYPRITLKKIPQMLLGRCEFGKDNYSMNIRESVQEELVTDFEA